MQPISEDDKHSSWNGLLVTKINDAQLRSHKEATFDLRPLRSPPFFPLLTGGMGPVTTGPNQIPFRLSLCTMVRDHIKAA